MTMHLHIDDQEIESQLTELAEQQNKSLEQQASELLASAIQHRGKKLQKLRDRLAVGKAQLDRGEGTDGETFFKELLGR